MRPLTRPRLYLAPCLVLFLLLFSAGGVSTSAGAVSRAVHHNKRHRPAPVSVLPSMGPLPSPSIFGVNTLGYDNNYAYYKRNVPTARSIGARWVHFTGGSVHFYRNGQPNWKTLDPQVTQARKLGLGVLISLGGTPKACSVASGRKNPESCPPTTSRDLAAYQTFLRSELLRYHDVVQYWESWVEPNGPGEWLGRADPQQYANLLRAQYQVFQSFNTTHHTDLKLLFGGPISFGTAPNSTSIAVLPFVNEVLNDLHGARAFDAVGLHAYRFPASNSGPPTENWGPTALNWDYVEGLSFPEGQRCTGGALWCQMTWSDELRAYEQEFANHGYGQMPIWLTEFGWPGNASPTTALYPSFDTQAQYLTEAYDDLLALPFVQGAFWFDLRDYQPGIVSPDPAFFYHFGLLQYGFAPKPAATEFEQLAAANPGR
jgi:hypothetical protein